MRSPRRVLLKMFAATPLLACGGGSGTPASFGVVSAGNVSSTNIDTLAVVPNAPAILARDEHGLYALTNTCTHEGCDVSPSSGLTLYCSCHGSRFDGNGNVLKGPAGTPLVHFAVTVDAQGNISVDGTKQVAPEVRTPVS